MTTYKRTDSANSLGLHYIDYVNAMIEVCNNRCIPCYNNYINSGIDFTNDDIRSWADEGIYLDNKVNLHLSPKGYQFLVPKYEEFIKSN